MKIIALTLLLSTALFFGFTLFLMSYEMGHSGCLAERAMGASCPAGGLSFFSFHVEAFKDITTTIAAGIFILTFLMIYIGAAYNVVPRIVSSARYYVRCVRDSITHFLNTAVFSWIAFHEESPSYTFARALVNV